MDDGLREIRNELIYFNKNMEALTLEIQKTNMLISMQTTLNLMKDAVNIGAISDETYFNSIKGYLNELLAKEGGAQDDSTE